MSKLKLFVFIVGLFLSCKSEKSITHDNSEFLKPKNFTPVEFLQLFRSGNNGLYFVTIEDDFPSDWITETQIDTLILYVKSKERAHCFMNPLSSHIPTDTAELGGYAIKLISAYKEKKAITFGLYSCPLADDIQADSLIEWWTHKKVR